MIDFLKGMIISSTDQAIILDISGIGFSLLVPQPHAFKMHEQIHVFVHMHWNPENGPQLYGFNNDSDRQAFLQIISCTGIGPKLGLAILKHMPTNIFFSCILAHDVKALSSVPGVGIKKAEILILQLKDKIAKLMEGMVIPVQTNHFADISQALHTLHYSRAEIQIALDTLRKNVDCSTISFEELMRKALQTLSQL